MLRFMNRIESYLFCKAGCDWEAIGACGKEFLGFWSLEEG
jgi:hypothetical protein